MSVLTNMVELADCVQLMVNLVTISIQLRYLSSFGYSNAVASIARGATSESLKTFYIFLPLLALHRDSQVGRLYESVGASLQKGAKYGVFLRRWLGRLVEEDNVRHTATAVTYE